MGEDDWVESSGNVFEDLGFPPEEAAQLKAVALQKLTAEQRWKSQWPAHCRACNGWGGAVFYESHGLPGPAEQMFDVCDNCCGHEEHPRCGRCSFPFTDDEQASGDPCSKCGWRMDDGVPELDPSSFDTSISNCADCTTRDECMEKGCVYTRQEFPDGLE